MNTRSVIHSIRFVSRFFSVGMVLVLAMACGCETGCGEDTAVGFRVQPEVAVDRTPPAVVRDKPETEQASVDPCANFDFSSGMIPPACPS